VNYARAHHDYAATDILAKAGCKFVAPINGVVDEVNRVDTWRSPPNLGITRGGLSVSIIGEDGVRYYGSHLRSIPASIQPGVAVTAGRILGAIGATPPLHHLLLHLPSTLAVGMRCAIPLVLHHYFPIQRAHIFADALVRPLPQL